jgi:secreted trypsin-like serine protease
MLLSLLLLVLLLNSVTATGVSIEEAPERAVTGNGDGPLEFAGSAVVAITSVVVAAAAIRTTLEQQQVGDVWIDHDPYQAGMAEQEQEQQHANDTENSSASNDDRHVHEKIPTMRESLDVDVLLPKSQSRHLERDSDNDTNESRIVGGTAAPEGYYPHQVQILADHGYMVCGGSLVAADLVICAAHCTKYAGSVAIGRYTNLNLDTSSSFNTAGQVIPICNRFNHEDYDQPWARDSYDIALYQLCYPVQNYGPEYYISLNADANIPIGSTQATTSTLTVTGWGLLEQRGSPAELLQEVDVDYIPNYTCGGRMSTYSSRDIREDMMCAGKLRVGGKDACQGDSGGPLVIKGGGANQESLTSDDYYNPHILVGVVSWGSGCAQARAPGVYARISYFKDWLTAKARKESKYYSEIKWSTGGIVAVPSGADISNGVPDVSVAPSSTPSTSPIKSLSQAPIKSPSASPSQDPSSKSSPVPSVKPSVSPSSRPSAATSFAPSALPSWMPSVEPTTSPSISVAHIASQAPSTSQSPRGTPTSQPSFSPSASPTQAPSSEPTTGQVPSEKPTSHPSASPTTSPSSQPTITQVPSAKPTSHPSRSPSATPTSVPISKPTTSQAPNARPTNTSVLIVENGDTLSTPGAGRIRPVIYEATFDLEATLEDGCIDRVGTFSGRSGHTRHCSWIQKVGRPGATMSPSVRARKVNDRCRVYGTICPVMCGFCRP